MFVCVFHFISLTLLLRSAGPSHGFGTVLALDRVLVVCQILTCTMMSHGSIAAATLEYVVVMIHFKYCMHIY